MCHICIYILNYEVSVPTFNELNAIQLLYLNNDALCIYAMSIDSILTELIAFFNTWKNYIYRKNFVLYLK